jgi:hypothetical protein
MIFGDTVTDENQTEIIVGLSDGEKKDLEELITSFKKTDPSAPPDSSAEEVQNQIQYLTEIIAHLGDALIKIDAKMKSFHEILRLSHKKSEIMNQQIDTIIKTLKGQKDL